MVGLVGLGTVGLGTVRLGTVRLGIVGLGTVGLNMVGLDMVGLDTVGLAWLGGSSSLGKEVFWLGSARGTVPSAAGGFRRIGVGRERGVLRWVPSVGRRVTSDTC